ncbi:GGDEF domain-containing protein, partial [Sulfurimonas sp. MAG313]
MRLFLSLLLLVSFLNASIVLEKGIDQIDDFELLYYNDTSGSLGIDEILKVDFNQTISNRISLGNPKGKTWFKFILINNSENEDFLLNLNEAWFDKVNLYTFEKKKIVKSENGLNILLKN